MLCFCAVVLSRIADHSLNGAWSAAAAAGRGLPRAVVVCSRHSLLDSDLRLTWDGRHSTQYWATIAIPNTIDGRRTT